MKNTKGITDGLPKTNFMFFYQTKKTGFVVCNEEWSKAITKVAITVGRKYNLNHSFSPKIEVIAFSPNPDELPEGDLLSSQLPFIIPSFTLYIKVDGIKERIKLVGYIDFLGSAVCIKQEGDKNFIKKRTPYCSFSVVNDVGELLIRAISHKLSNIGRKISGK